MDYISLSTKFKSFDYIDYEIVNTPRGIDLLFHYQLTSDAVKIPFKHKVSYFLPKGISIEAEDYVIMKPFVFHIGLVETINYYKLACPHELNIHCGYINENQKEWWKKLFYHGLGEFIYLNKMVEQVNQENLVTFNCLSENGTILTEDRQAKLTPINTSGHMIPVGGGKDSVVTLELLKGNQDDNLPFVMSAPVAAFDCIQIAGYTDYLEARRIFDKRLIAMNDEGYLNGHVPFSAILAFIASLGSLISKKKYISLSNERSANEPSVLGTSFNHQYSKSFEFEGDFDTYLHQYLTEDITYFSLLRPLYEIEIGQLFAHYKKYHQAFRSCNRGKKDNTWCLSCSKCLFVFIILSPYIPMEELILDFGMNLYTQESLLFDFSQLIGLEATKPFECVGTVWEVRYAINTYLEQNPHAGDEVLLEYYLSRKANDLPAEPTDYEVGDLLTVYHKSLLSKERARLDITLGTD